VKRKRRQRDGTKRFALPPDTGGCVVRSNETPHPVRKEIQVPVSKERIAEVMAQHRHHEADTGSSEVQIALLTERIRNLTEHFKTHEKDHAGRRGLLKLVGQRRRLLNYLERTNIESYRKLIAELDLRR